MSDEHFADLAERNAVVTGASSGIGRAIALELARGGANVVLHCRQSQDSAQDVADEIRMIGPKAVAMTADFQDRSTYLPFVEDAWNAFGSVDLWINNAGADLLTGDGLNRPYSEKLQMLFDVDLRCTVELSKEVGRRMTAAGSGAAGSGAAGSGVILNIGWDQADRGMGGDSGELFAACKNAITGFSRSLAVSLAPSVRVNCIAPGWIRTKWGQSAGDAWQKRVLADTPLRRWGTPEDVAKMARFLVSDDAAYITGQVFNVNGGAIR